MQALLFKQTQWSRSDIILNEKGDILFKNKDIADTSNEYFGSTVEWLGLHMRTEGSKAFPAYERDNSIDNNLMKIVNYPNIRTIKENLNFCFNLFLSTIWNRVSQIFLNSSKSVGRDILTNFLKECEFTFSVLTDYINKSFETGTFPGCLKKPNVTPIFKKRWSS